MNKLLLISILFFLSFPAISKDVMGTYKTYEDYKNNILDTMDEYSGYTISKGSIIMRFLRDGAEQKIKCKEIWGFKMGNRLYRTDKKAGQPTCVISIGEIIYYENGIPYMEGYRLKSNAVEFSIGYLSYFSKNLSSEMVPYDPKMKTAEEPYSAFKKSNPKYEPLFKCLGKTDDYSKIRVCVKSFNATSGSK